MLKSLHSVYLTLVMVLHYSLNMELILKLEMISFLMTTLLIKVVNVFLLRYIIKAANDY